jgi:hypothetical protein
MDRKPRFLDDPYNRFYICLVLDLGIMLDAFGIYWFGARFLLLNITWIVLDIAVNIWWLLSDNYTRMPQVLAAICAFILVFAAKMLSQL